MLIAALFIVTQDWKQPKYPSSGEWISKWRCISNGTAQSANTRNMDKSKNHCSKRKIQKQRTKTRFLHYDDILEKAKLERQKSIWWPLIVCEGKGLIARGMRALLEVTEIFRSTCQLEQRLRDCKDLLKLGLYISKEQILLYVNYNNKVDSKQ